MPRSKREKEVKKKTKESKKTLVKDIRDSVNDYANLFVFNVDNMRATKFVQVRQKYKTNSRFFMGKNNVMAIALGRDASTEQADQLHKRGRRSIDFNWTFLGAGFVRMNTIHMRVSSMLKGQCGLMFTNADKNAVIKFFKEFKESDHARGGQDATDTVELAEGPLPQFPFSIEPQLRKLGLPTKLDKGVVTLISDFVVCREGDKLTPEQARILKLLNYQMSTFQVNVLAHWAKDSGFTFVD